MTAPALAVSAPPGRSHLHHVDGLRAAAALVVFVNHAYAQVWQLGQDQVPGGALSAFTYSMVFGHLSVTVFIVISGFCLALPAISSGDRLRGGAKSFFQRRARRILPPYYGAVALSLGLIWTVIGKPTGTLWDVPIQVTPSSILSHLVLLQDLFGTGSINYVFWSIAVEWQIYFLFPLLLWLWRRIGPLGAVGVTVGVSYLVRFAVEGTRIERAHPHFLGMFALGMLAAYVVKAPGDWYARARRAVPWAWLGVLATGATLLVLKLPLLVRAFGGGTIAGAPVRPLDVLFPGRDQLLFEVNTAIGHFHFFDLFVGLATLSVLVLSSRDEDSVLRRIFGWKPLVFIGTFSYSVYLIHAPLLQLMWQFVLHPAGLGDRALFAASN